jgi:SnoaL-like domain
MSQENVEILRRAEANDLEAIAARMHPEIRGTAVSGWPEPGPFVGRDAALAETKRLIEWGENRFTDIDAMADEGDWVVVAYRWHVRGAGSGIETHFDVASAVRMKDALVIEWHNRWTRDEALEAAGLRECPRFCFARKAEGSRMALQLREVPWLAPTELRGAQRSGVCPPAARRRSRARPAVASWWR